MASRRFKFRYEPFGVTPDPKFLFLSRTHREAMAALQATIEHRRGFMVLLGEPGTGKTTLLYQMLQRYQNSAETAFVFQTQGTSTELLQHISADLGLEATDNLVETQARLRDFFVQAHRAHKGVVVVVDEAQNLTAEALETVRLLSNYETAETKLLQIVLAGQEQLASRLEAPELAQLLQRVALMRRLLPLDREEIAAYVQHRLRIAGATDPIFSEEAIAEIAIRSGGVPRNINRLCYSALAIAEAAGCDAVDAEIVARADSERNGVEAAGRPERRPPAQVVPFSPISAGGWSSGSSAVQPAFAPFARATPYAEVSSRPGPVGAPERQPVARPVDEQRLVELPHAEPDDVPHEIGTENPELFAPSDAEWNRADSRVELGAQSRPAVEEELAPAPVAPDAREDAFIATLRGAEAQGRKERPLPTGGPSQRARGLRKALTVVGLVLGVCASLVAGAWLYKASTPLLARFFPPAAGSKDAAGVATPPEAAKAEPAAAPRPAQRRPERAPETGEGAVSTPRATAPAGARKNVLGSGEQIPAVNVTFLPPAPASAPPQAERAASVAAAPPTSAVTASDQRLPAMVSNFVNNVHPPVPERPEPPAPTRSEAVLIHRVAPQYPPLARQLRVEGKVVLRVDITAEGTVADARRLSGSALLAKAAVEAVRQWRYTPALVDGKPAKTVTTVVVDFQGGNR